jgi:arabinan endo-1,5-alpha-L-arabinosidase
MLHEPVWHGYFADPFVLRDSSGFYAYGTSGPDLAGVAPHFPILRSHDLRQWEHIGHSLRPPKGREQDSFWAPEVAYRDGLYYLYYSSGGPDGQDHKLRVATAQRPEGPFHSDDVALLPDEPFSIDAHPFHDPASDRWFLFFAKDFFDGRSGTGIAVVEFAPDLMSVSGDVQTIIRPSADWQIYQRNRHWYGITWPAWHTVEGPFVVFKGGRYWLFYSGGLWKGSDYGVSYAVADHVLGPYVEWQPELGPKLLRTSATQFGPGHNSVVEASHRSYIIYHAWDSAYTARRMFVDELAWSADGPRVVPVESRGRRHLHD